MGFKCGIVGLPNVGKSTLFNALTETSSAEAANYPFCTIEPNSGIVSVPDKRLTLLSELVKSQKVGIIFCCTNNFPSMSLRWVTPLPPPRNLFPE